MRRMPKVFENTRNRVIDSTAIGTEADTVKLTLSNRYSEEAPKIMPRKAPAKDETAGAKHDAGAAKNDGAATNALPSADPSPTGVRPDKRTGPAIEGRVEGRAASAAQSALHSGASEIPGPAVAAALPPGFPGSAAAPAVPAR